MPPPLLSASILYHVYKLHTHLVQVLSLMSLQYLQLFHLIVDQYPPKLMIKLILLLTFAIQCFSQIEQLNFDQDDEKNQFQNEFQQGQNDVLNVLNQQQTQENNEEANDLGAYQQENINQDQTTLLRGSNSLRSCRWIKCRKGQHCVEGKCIQIGCNCPQGTSCRKGQCYPDNFQICPTQLEYQLEVCRDPRPTIRQCPVISYVRAPDPVLCGITADGTKIDFVRSCQACMRADIIYYFKTPCHKTPFVCIEGQYCKDNSYCSKECNYRQECPYDWQDCVQGQCTDPCVYMRCANCKYGQCNYQQPYGKCTSISGPDSSCANQNWACIGFQCSDPCLRRPCFPYQRCVLGSCEPQSQ